MQIRVEKVFTIDIDKEQARLEKCFKGKVLARQTALLELFQKGNFNGFIEAYNALPYSKEDECPEKEYVGMALVDFIHDCLRHDMKVVKIET